MDADLNDTETCEKLLNSEFAEEEREFNLELKRRARKKNERTRYSGNIILGTVENEGKDREWNDKSNEFIRQARIQNDESISKVIRSGNDHDIYGTRQGVNRFRRTNNASGFESDKMWDENGKTYDEIFATDKEYGARHGDAFTAFSEISASKERLKNVSRAEGEGGEDNEETDRENSDIKEENGRYGTYNYAPYEIDKHSHCKHEEGEEGKDEVLITSNTNVNAEVEEEEEDWEDLIEEEFKHEEEEEDEKVKLVLTSNTIPKVEHEVEDWEDLIDEEFKNYYALPVPEPFQPPLLQNNPVCAANPIKTRQHEKLLRIVRRHIPATWRLMPQDAAYRWFDVQPLSAEFYYVSDPIRQCNLIALQMRRLQNPIMFNIYVVRRQELSVYYSEVNLECLRYLCVNITDIEKIATHNVDPRYLGLRKRDVNLYSTPCKAIKACFLERPVLVVCRTIRPGIKTMYLNETYPEYVINFRQLIKKEHIKIKEKISLESKYEDNQYISPLFR